MKRTITKLEEKLIGLGYKLVSKQYGGKHSQKVVAYTYFRQEDEGNFVKLILDKKREEIINFILDGVDFRQLEVAYEQVQKKMKQIHDEITTIKEFESPIKVA